MACSMCSMPAGYLLSRILELLGTKHAETRDLCAGAPPAGGNRRRELRRILSHPAGNCWLWDRQRHATAGHSLSPISASVVHIRALAALYRTGAGQHVDEAVIGCAAQHEREALCGRARKKPRRVTQQYACGSRSAACRVASDQRMLVKFRTLSSCRRCVQLLGRVRAASAKVLRRAAQIIQEPRRGGGFR